MKNKKAPHKTKVHTLLEKAVRLQQEGDLVGAEQLCREVLSQAPGNADAYHLLGLMANSIGHPDIAIGMLGQAIKLNGHAPAYYHNLATILKGQDRLEDALLLYAHALQLMPNAYEIAANLGKTHLDLNNMGDARLWLQKAIDLKPDYAFAHWNLAFLDLLEGHFKKGWERHEWRWRLDGARPKGLPGTEWDGSDLRGKTILLYSEQGIGDSIQFVRFAPLLKAMGATVVLFCIEQVGRLFAGFPGIDSFIVGSADKLPPHDYVLPLMSLPYRLGTTLETLPAGIPYLHADPAGVAQWKARLAGLEGLKVGVAWRGNPTHKNDRNRSAKAVLFATALDTPGISIVNLQKDATEEELAALNNGGPVYNPAAELHDLTDTAALIANLDLVISVDTAVCHLAGAMGAPVWTLLPFAPDWRWLLQRSDTPWYPTMRLFRQPSHANWPAVMQAVKDALKAMV